MNSARRRVKRQKFWRRKAKSAFGRADLRVSLGGADGRPRSNPSSPAARQRRPTKTFGMVLRIPATTKRTLFCHPLFWRAMKNRCFALRDSGSGQINVVLPPAAAADGKLTFFWSPRFGRMAKDASGAARRRGWERIIVSVRMARRGRRALLFGRSGGAGPLGFGVRGQVRDLKLGDMSPSRKAATCRHSPKRVVHRCGAGRTNQILSCHGESFTLTLLKMER